MWHGISQEIINKHDVPSIIYLAYCKGTTHGVHDKGI